MTREQIHRRRWGILGVLILALFGVSIDNTILNIALPTLASELGASASQLQWMVNSYILVFAGLLLVAGTLSDRYGRRKLLVTGLALFGVGSAVTPFVSSAEALIALRAFMGVGAALTMPATLSILADVFEPAERPKAIAAWSAVSGLGIVVGPIVGGWLLEHFAWESVFLINVPMVIIGIAATLAIVPESRSPERHPIDVPGVALSVAGVTALVFGIIEAPHAGWTSPEIVVALGAAGLLLTAFAWWERRTAHPMIDLRLFRDRRFSAASLSVTLTFFALMGAMFFLTLYMQGVLGLSALETGVRFIPIAVGIIGGSVLSAQATARLGTRFTASTGLAVVALGLGAMATLGIASSDLHVAVLLLVTAFGMGVAMTPSTDAIMAALPKSQFGVGSAINDTTRELGGAMGVAILGSLFAAGYTAVMAGPAAGLPPEAAAIARDSLAGAAAVAEAIGGAAGAALLEAARAAFVDALRVSSLVGAAVGLVGAGLAFAFLPDRVTRPTEEAAGEGERTPAPAVRGVLRGEEAAA